MKITILLSIFFSKYTPKRINRNMFSKFSPWVISHSKRVSKIFIFYIKNDDFWKILKTKSDQNTHQNAPNCTILNKFMGGGGGAWPRTPLAKRMASPWATCKFPNPKKKILPPPTKSWLRPWAYAESIGKRADFTGRPTWLWLCSGACAGGEPRNWKAKKNVIRANIKLFHLYFATFLVENIIFSAIFWAGPPWKKKRPPLLRIPEHAPGVLTSRWKSDI